MVNKNPMTKVCIFPYAIDDIAIVRNMEKLYDNLEISDIVTISGLVADNSDVNEILNRKEANKKVSFNLDKGLSECDLLFITKGDKSDKSI